MRQFWHYMKKSEHHTRHPFLGTRDQIGKGFMDASFQLISASGWSMVQDSLVLMALEILQNRENEK